MTEIFGLSAAAAAGLVFLVLKFGDIRKVLLFDIPIDIVCTGVLMISMSGTYTGIMIAIIAGGIISAVLWGLKQAFPPYKLTSQGWDMTVREPSWKQTLKDKVNKL
jgi:hypothetical protein